jgi:hypothetical protein
MQYVHRSTTSRRARPGMLWRDRRSAPQDPVENASRREGRGW